MLYLQTQVIVTHSILSWSFPLWSEHFVTGLEMDWVVGEMSTNHLRSFICLVETYLATFGLWGTLKFASHITFQISQLTCVVSNSDLKVQGMKLRVKQTYLPLNWVMSNIFWESIFFRVKLVYDKCSALKKATARIPDLDQTAVPDPPMSSPPSQLPLAIHHGSLKAHHCQLSLSWPNGQNCQSLLYRGASDSKSI